MSKGLSYLAAVRPEAMSGLLQFYGKSVQALDDKTRLLISLVTKVVNGTERGLRQYAPQAYAAGASKEEILDAVLMAFPAAGLTKVIDAVQILLKMDLVPPLAEDGELSSDSGSGTAGTRRLDLGPVAGWAPGVLHAVTSGGTRYLVYSAGSDDWKVYSARCPHADGDLTLGTCDAHVVECPVHHWRFDLQSGEGLDHKRLPLTAIPSDVRDGRLYIEVA